VTAGPLVSILLPCFDAERFLPTALDSLVRQTYTELEILALDDGSRDATLQILEAHAVRDARIRVLRNAANRGLIAALNRLMSEARGPFVARMDADDIAMPQRVERQIEILLRRPEIDAVGTGVQVVGADARSRVRPRPVRSLEPGGARFMGLFGPPVVHPTLLARASVMRAHPYGASVQSLHTEDYELFTRMLSAGVQFANLPEPLVAVRVQASGVSLRHERTQIANFVECAARHLEQTLDVRPDPAVLRVLVNRMDAGVTSRDLRDGLRLLDRVERAFLAREPGSSSEITGIADEQRVDIVVQALLKADPAVRLTALTQGLLRTRRVVSHRSRRYLAGKLPGARGARSGQAW
jgi:glycosyltransferase involved in cell wall biosynthesis